MEIYRTWSSRRRMDQATSEFEVLGCVFFLHIHGPINTITYTNIQYACTHVKFISIYMFESCVYTDCISVYIYIHINIDTCTLHAFLFIKNKIPPRSLRHVVVVSKNQVTSISESKRMLRSHKCRKAWRTVLKLMTSTGKTTAGGWNNGWVTPDTNHFGDFGGDFWMGQNGRMTWNDCVFRAQEEVLFWCSILLKCLWYSGDEDRKSVV